MCWSRPGCRLRLGRGGVTNGDCLDVAVGLVADEEEEEDHFGERAGSKDGHCEVVLGRCAASHLDCELTVGGPIEGEPSQDQGVVEDVVVDVGEGHSVGVGVVAGRDGGIIVVIVKDACLV